MLAYTKKSEIAKNGYKIWKKHRIGVVRAIIKRDKNLYESREVVESNDKRMKRTKIYMNQQKLMNEMIKGSNEGNWEKLPVDWNHQLNKNVLQQNQKARQESDRGSTFLLVGKVWKKIEKHADHIWIYIRMDVSPRRGTKP